MPEIGAFDFNKYDIGGNGATAGDGKLTGAEAQRARNAGWCIWDDFTKSDAEKGLAADGFCKGPCGTGNAGAILIHNSEVYSRYLAELTRIMAQKTILRGLYIREYNEKAWLVGVRYTNPILQAILEEAKKEAKANLGLSASAFEFGDEYKTKLDDFMKKVQEALRKYAERNKPQNENPNIPQRPEPAHPIKPEKPEPIKPIKPNENNPPVVKPTKPSATNNEYSKLSKKEAEKRAANDDRLEYIGNGGNGWSCSDKSFVNDIKYATKGTKALLDKVVEEIRKIDPSFTLIVTSALGTSGSPHKKSAKNSHYNPNNVKLDFGGGYSKSKAYDVAKKLMRTGYFQFANPEDNHNGTWHIDAMFKPEALEMASEGEL